MKKLLKEPLIHFLLISAGLFLLFGWRGNSFSPSVGKAGMPSSQIIVTQSSIEQMKSQFEKTWQRHTVTMERPKAASPLAAAANEELRRR